MIERREVLRRQMLPEFAQFLYHGVDPTRVSSAAFTFSLPPVFPSTASSFLATRHDTGDVGSDHICGYLEFGMVAGAQCSAVVVQTAKLAFEKVRTPI